VLVASDRRTQLRFRASLGVTDPRQGVVTTTRDVSTDGMFVRGLAYPVGERIAVEVLFPEYPVPMRVTGDVVRADGSGVALRLFHASEPQRLHFSGAIVRLAEATTEPGE
jgi:hypothetical protein